MFTDFSTDFDNSDMPIWYQEFHHIELTLWKEMEDRFRKAVDLTNAGEEPAHGAMLDRLLAKFVPETLAKILKTLEQFNFVSEEITDAEVQEVSAAYHEFFSTTYPENIRMKVNLMRVMNALHKDHESARNHNKTATTLDCPLQALKMPPIPLDLVKPTGQPIPELLEKLAMPIGDPIPALREAPATFPSTLRGLEDLKPLALDALCGAFGEMLTDFHGNKIIFPRLDSVRNAFAEFIGATYPLN